MARGKIQIKRIEKSTNRQVTYSKRRNGLFKKAGELTVLCDAKVSIIMLSISEKLHEYISPSTTTKEVFDQYQRALGVDIWSTQYQRMQDTLKKLKDVNKNLRREIRQRMGECLNSLGVEDMCALEQEMDNAVSVIRERKYKVLANQIDTTRKKVKSGQDLQRKLLQEMEAREEDPYYGLVYNGEDYESFLGYPPRGPPRVLALCLQPTHASLPSDFNSDLTTCNTLLCNHISQT